MLPSWDPTVLTLGILISCRGQITMQHVLIKLCPDFKVPILIFKEYLNSGKISTSSLSPPVPHSESKNTIAMGTKRKATFLKSTA